MIIETRKTAQGTEYWDKVEKKSLFVPAGEKPSFEVTENPKSMIMGVDLSSEPDKTVVSVIDFESMTVPKLKKYALDHNITIQTDLTKKEDIIKYLTEELEKALDDAE